MFDQCILIKSVRMLLPTLIKKTVWSAKLKQISLLFNVLKNMSARHSNTQQDDLYQFRQTGKHQKEFIVITRIKVAPTIPVTM